VSDWLQAGHTADELRALAAASPPWDPSAASAESSALATGAAARDAPERAVLGEDVRIRWPGPPALEVRKDNGGRRTPAFALRLRFAPGGAVTVADAELAEAPDLLARTSVARRVTATLAAGALTVPELAAAVAASEATVGRAVRRLREQGHVVLVDGAQPWRWELASR
jgi:hypothetical protein